MVVQHQPLPKRRMRPPLHRVRLQPAVITDALARRTQQRQNGDRQRADQQQAVPPVRARNMDRRESHPEAHVLDVPKARLNPPALAVVPNQDPRRDCRFAGHQAPRFVHLRILYAHDHADRQLVRVGHPSTHQPPRTPPGADPRGGRSPLAPRIRHIDVSTQPNHVFEGQLRRQRVEQLAIRKAPVGHNGDFHPGRQHLPQPAQHLVLIAPLITLQRRGGHRLPQQGRRAPMASHHRQHDRVLPVGRSGGGVHPIIHDGKSDPSSSAHTNGPASSRKSSRWAVGFAFRRPGRGAARAGPSAQCPRRASRTSARRRPGRTAPDLAGTSAINGADLLPAIAVGCQRSPGDRGHVDDGRRAPWLRHRLTVFAQALDVKPDCLADLADRLFPGRSGRHAAG